VKALIVDDSRAMRAMLRSIMVDLGFEVAEAGNGNEGLVQLIEHPDTVVALVDWNMPEMDGLDFVKALRRKREHADLKVMMVTAENDMAKMARALMAGADEYAMKPLTRDAIVEKLELLGVCA
jgi:two-component system, chemotaxis family, chemotaxis protein CheY